MPSVQIPANVRGAYVEVQKIGVNGQPAGKPEIICTHKPLIDKLACRLGYCPLRIQP